MAIVMGADFCTLSVRVTLYDSERGRLATATTEYPLHRRVNDGAYATQSHFDQMDALAKASHAVLESAGVDGDQVASIAIDAAGSGVLMVDAQMRPLDEYYLWCDTRAFVEAQQITAAVHAGNFEAIQWCGGFYSPERGFAKVLHWLRHILAECSDLLVTMERFLRRLPSSIEQWDELPDNITRNTSNGK